MRTLMTILLFLPVAVIPASSGAPDLAGRGEDVLLLLSFEGAAEAARVTTAPVRLLQRLPEGMLAAVAAGDVHILARRGIAAEVLDLLPSVGSYALVGSFRHAQLRESYPGTDVRVLKAWPDHQLVKAWPEDLVQLRERGYSVVDVRTVGGIPADLPARMVLPQVRVDSSIAAIIALVSDSSIGAYVQGLQNFTSRYWANANRDTIARWVRARYIQSGLADAALDSFQYSGTWQKNVVASIPGGGEQEAEMIVGGHHDSYSSNLSQAPGADDNATGTAAALEMARVLKVANYSPSLTLRFMGFAAEEAGLVGSDRYATAARTQGRNIKAMLNYDMIGNRNAAQGDRDVYVVWYTGAEALRDLHAAMMRMYTTLTPVPTTSYRSGSDSYSFWEQSYPAVFCIERDFSPYYHSPNDLIQYLDIPYARDIVRSGLATLLTLDQAPPPVPGLRVRDRGDGISLLAEWDSIAVPDFYRYRVYFGTEPGVYTSNTQQTTRSKVFSSLTAGTTYYIGVSIIDLAGREGFITEGSARPAVVPSPPAALRIEDTGSGVRLAWHPNPEVDLAGYHVYQSFALPVFMRLTGQPQADTTFALPAEDAWYYVTAVDQQAHESDSSNIVFASSTAVSGSGGLQPLEFTLVPNYPNPFNGETRIGYTVPGSAGEGGGGAVSLKVYDVLGRIVTTLVDGPVPPGDHTAIFDARNLPSGVYVAVLRSGPVQRSVKMLLMK